MAKAKPYCQTGPTWVADRIARETGDTAALAPLTGQDTRAFAAFFHLVALYGNADDAGRSAAVAAMYHTVRAMQPSTRSLCKAGIPHVLDWSHEEEIWRAISAYAVTILGRPDLGLTDAFTRALDALERR
jgi:hypothetical protein